MTLLLLAGAIAALLVLLFPRGGTLDLSRSDELAIAYLKIRLRAEPENRPARVALARHQMDLGRWADAWQALAFFETPRPQHYLEADLLALELKRRELAAAGEERARRTHLRGLGQTIEGLLAAHLKLPIDRAELIAGIALELGRPDLSALALEAGARSADPQPALELDLRAVAKWRSANRNARALALMGKLLGRFPAASPPERERLYEQAVEVALAANHLSQARTWLAQWIARFPENDPLRKRQFKLALAAHDLPAALRSAEELVARQSQDPEAHRQVGTVAEWVKRPRRALTEWRWLAHHTHNAAFLDHALQLARGLQVDGLVAELLLLKGRRYELSRAELASLVYTLERAGTPDPAKRFLRDYAQRHPYDREAWRTLAAVEERQGDLVAALATREELLRRFGTRIEDATKRAELLWRLHRPTEALAQLKSVRTAASPHDQPFWRLLAELAWRAEMNSDALVAYRTLWENDVREPAGAERLLLLAFEARALDLAMRVAREAWHQLHEPRLLVLALDGAFRASAWRDFAGLLHLAQQDPARFQSHEHYWLMVAKWATHRHRLPEAYWAFAHALAAEPRSATSKLGWLWLAIDHHDRPQIAALCARFRADALLDPAFWNAYAVAYDQLGQLEEALPWYERQARSQPSDLHFLVSYADVLRRSGRPVAADRLQHFLLERLQTRLHARKTPTPPQLLVAYASLVQQLRGQAAARRLVEPLAAHRSTAAEVRDFVVSMELDDGNPEAARFWLKRWPGAERELSSSRRLELALAEADRAAALAILDDDEEAARLSRVERADGEVQVGREEMAWALANQELALGRGRSGPEELDALTAEVHALAPRHVPTAQLDWHYDNLGPIQLHQLRGRFDLGRQHGFRLTGELSYHHVDADSVAVPSHEAGLLLAMIFEQLRGQTILAVGANLRADQSLFQAHLEQRYRLRHNLLGRAALAIGELTLETSALRATGSQNRLTGSLSLDLTPREFAQWGIEWRDYRSRDWAWLGEGMALHFEAGHRLSASRPDLRLQATGTLLINRLPESLPVSVTALWPAIQRPDELVPIWLASLGLGAELHSADSDLVRYHVDAWLGWMWPASQLAYHLRLRLGLGIRLLGAPGEINVGGFFSNDLNGARHEGLEFLYMQRFSG